MAFAYEGFKLGEKKSLKENEHFYISALKQIQDKLGADWKLTIDWNTIQQKTSDSPDNNDSAKYDRKNLHWSIYENYCKSIGNEVAGWDKDTAEAVSESVKDKEFFITFDPEIGSHNRRAIVKVDASKITFLLAQNGLSDYYLVNSLTEAVMSAL